MNCSKCGEKMYEVDEIMMCGSRFCTNYKIVKSEAPSESIIYHREVMLRMKKTSDRVKYLLETKPHSRNFPDWIFLNFYWEYFLGYTKGMEYSDFWKNQIGKFALPETVRRSHQLVCESELNTIKEYLKQVEDEAYFSPNCHLVQHKIQQFLRITKYIPTDLDLIKKKLEKQSAIFESVVMEKIEA